MKTEQEKQDELSGFLDTVLMRIEEEWEKIGGEPLSEVELENLTGFLSLFFMSKPR